MLESAAVAAFADGFPVSPGHTLVVPKQHVEDLFALEAADFAAVWALVAEVRALLLEGVSPPPDGFNVGVNAGAAAGQTIDHAHVHVIPRFAGDMDEPRGGIRKVIPERARYWQ